MFQTEQTKPIEQRKETSNGILWVEATAFSLLIALSWLTEILHFPHLVFGEPFTPNWTRATLRTIVLLFIWLWVFLATKKLLQRLHYLEEFVRVCSWCRKVSHEDEWLQMENYFDSKFDTKTSHGMCPDCLRKTKEEIAATADHKILRL